MTSRVVKPAKPPNAGKGRVKGVPNKSTKAVRDALLAVYADLQANQAKRDGTTGAGAKHAHLLAWAESNPAAFYPLWAKLLPREITGPEGGPIQTEVIDELAGLPRDKRDAIRVAIKTALDANAE